MKTDTAAGKVIGILQPGYLPWLGSFEQMARADRWVVLDDVQYTKGDWRNRNRIKSHAGPVWLTVPVRRHSTQTLIRDISISNDRDWAKKHLRIIEAHYRRAPHYQPFFGELADVLAARHEKLADLCRVVTATLCRHLDIDTPMLSSSEIPRRPVVAADGMNESDLRRWRKNHRLIEICQHVGATTFYDGAKAAAFLDLDRFREAGIEVALQNYRHPVYRQERGAFLPYLSAIDLIMNVGPEAGTILRSSPLPPALERRRQARG